MGRASFDRKKAEFYMRLALREAKRGLGRTSPNPVVGAVLVKGGRIIARGHHKRAGAPHAEVVALAKAGALARGADLYTTLEPCNHYGRTPPCTLAILEAGVKRVICASLDPNPLVNGRGAARLRRAGIEVVTGVLGEEGDQLNRSFFKFVRTGLPWITVKAAITLDGKIATSTGDSRWVSGKQARAYVHRLRNQVDAILIGANTARLDNPRLTTRLPGGRGRDAIRVVLDSRLRLPQRLKVFEPRPGVRTIVATLEARNGRRARALLRRGVDVWKLQSGQGGVNVRDLMRRLARGGIAHVLVEGGAQVYATVLSQRLADELVLFIAPKLVGDGGLSWTGSLKVDRMKNAIALQEVSIHREGEDIVVRGLPDYPRRRA